MQKISDAMNLAMGRICLYYRKEPERDRWVKGDRYIRPMARRLLRGRPTVGGVEKVFVNLCLGLDRIGVRYCINLPFKELQEGDCIGVLGRGKSSLEGYDRPFPIVAGIGLMTHPSEWPTLCEEYPVVRYLQHSEWTANIYRPFYGDRCEIWPVGIDTEIWTPLPQTDKKYDFLIYDKIMWSRDTVGNGLIEGIQKELRDRKLTYNQISYGKYKESDYRKALGDCKSMIFLCEHESQGLAYQECLSSDIPILAWDQGRYLDPHCSQWNQPEVGASSVPFFDERCGGKFRGISDFSPELEDFCAGLRAGKFRPREYILENLTVEKCSRDFLSILEHAQQIR